MDRQYAEIKRLTLALRTAKQRGDNLAVELRKVRHALSQRCAELHELQRKFDEYLRDIEKDKVSS